MARYTASNPITGNSSYSFVDQEEADLRLKYLDDNGCNYCTACNYCNNCYDCNNCTACTDCNYCKNCTNVQSSQDYLILGPAQSSGRMTYAYIDSKLKSLVISCGCFKGSPDEFKAIISKTHKDSPIYLVQYNAFAACIEASLSHRIPE